MSDYLFGPPVQDLPENQDPSVAYMTNHITGEVTPLAGGPLDVPEKGSKVEEKPETEEKPKPRKGKARKQVAAKEVGSAVDEETVEKASAAAAAADEKPED